MVYTARGSSARPRRQHTQLSDSDLSSLEDGTASSDQLSSDGGPEREGRTLHSVSKRQSRTAFSVRKRAKAAYRKMRDAKGKRKNIQVTRAQRCVCWGIALAVFVALGVWGWKADVYATTKEFVTFPTLTTPVDIASVANQVASGAASVANVVGDAFKDAFHIGRREVIDGLEWLEPGALPAPPLPEPTAEVWPAESAAVSAASEVAG